MNIKDLAKRAHIEISEEFGKKVQQEIDALLKRYESLPKVENVERRKTTFIDQQNIDTISLPEKEKGPQTK